MAFGFHLVTVGNLPANEVLSRVDGVASGLGFLSRASVWHGFHQRFYRQSDHHPELLVAFDFQTERCAVSVYPLEEKELLAYGSQLLVRLWSSVAISLHAALGRTFLDIGFGTIQTGEIDGPLLFVDWYQYYSLHLVERWGLPRLKEGPFYRVDEYPNGACGLWLAPSPLERLGRLKAAEYLGVQLPKLYGKNPQTGEQMEIPWN